MTIGARSIVRFPLVAAAIALSFAAPAAAQTSMTIYSDGRVLVRRSVAVAVPRGTSRHRVELDQFDPGSLVALDPGVTIADVEYPRELDEATLYRLAIGRRILFQLPGTRDTVSAVVLGDDPPRFEVANGQIRFTPPGTPLFPRELTGIARPTTIVVESDRALASLVLGYVSEGAGWTAEYSVLIAGRSAEVSGRVVLRSDEIRVDSAEISILEGQVARVIPRRAELRQDVYRLDEIVMAGSAVAAPPPTPIGVGGFRTYALPGRHTLTPGHTTVGRLFAPIATPIERVHTVTGLGPAFGVPEQSLPVEVRYRIPRARETPFGAQAIPPGFARLYARTPAGTALLVGEAIVSHADPGSTLELVAGHAVEVTALRIPSRMTTVQDSLIGPDGRPQIVATGQVADLEVRFANVSDTTAVVEMTEQLPGSARVVSSSVPSDSAGPNLTRFRVQVPARGQTVLRYRIRISP